MENFRFKTCWTTDLNCKVKAHLQGVSWIVQLPVSHATDLPFLIITVVQWLMFQLCYRHIITTRSMGLFSSVFTHTTAMIVIGEMWLVALCLDSVPYRSIQSSISVNFGFNWFWPFNVQLMRSQLSMTEPENNLWQMKSLEFPELYITTIISYLMLAGRLQLYCKQTLSSKESCGTKCKRGLHYG